MYKVKVAGGVCRPCRALIPVALWTLILALTAGCSSSGSGAENAQPPGSAGPGLTFTASAGGGTVPNAPPTPTGTALPRTSVRSLPGGIALHSPLPAPPGRYDAEHSDPRDSIATYDGVSRAQYNGYLAELARAGFRCAATTPSGGGVFTRCQGRATGKRPDVGLTLGDYLGETAPGLLTFSYHYF